MLCSWSALQVGTLSLRLEVVSICNIWDYLEFGLKPAASSLWDPTGPQVLDSGLCLKRSPWELPDWDSCYVQMCTIEDNSPNTLLCWQPALRRCFSAALSALVSLWVSLYRKVSLYEHVSGWSQTSSLRENECDLLCYCIAFKWVHDSYFLFITGFPNTDRKYFLSISKII